MPKIECWGEEERAFVTQSREQMKEGEEEKEEDK